MRSVLFACLALGVSACGGDDTVMQQTAPPTKFKVRIENIAPFTALKSGTASQKTNGGSGALAPGEAYEMTFTAGKGQAVSFAAMFGESNDWFFAPGPQGIALYDQNGNAMSGDVTGQVQLWNAGTEVDEEPAVGPDTGPQQGSNPDKGAPDPDNTVRAIGLTTTLSAGSTFAVPAVSSMIKVTLTPGANRSFTLHVENASNDTTLVTSAGSRAIHISPPIWAVHTAAGPFFTPGMPDRGQGLEQIAESGRNGFLATAMAELSGAATPVSPGVFVVHSGGEPLYSMGQADRGQGLERIAENGNPMILLASLQAAPPAGASSMGVFNMPVGATSPGAATPGHAYEFEISAMPGERLSFAQMFGMSDDWFFGTPPGGLALFDGDTPLTGDFSDDLAIYDAGTEVNEELAIGMDTGPQQSMPDQGPADPIRQVRLVTAADYARTAQSHLRVTVTPE